MGPTDIKLKQSANHPTNDTGTVGGNMSGVDIDASSVGEWMPEIRGRAYGSLDTWVRYQYQLAYVYNTHGTETLQDGGIQILNNIILHNLGQIQAVSTSASDGSSKYLRIWGRTGGGALATENLPLNGTTPVLSAGSYQQVIRAELRLVSNGALVNAAGEIQLTEDGDQLALMPVGFDCVTQEYSLSSANALFNRSTWANRRTAPPSGEHVGFDGLFKSYPIDLALNIGPGQYLGVYCRQDAWPGLPTMDIRLAMRVSGTIV